MASDEAPDGKLRPVGRVVAKAATGAVNMAVAGSAAVGAAVLHSWPILAVGGVALYHATAKIIEKARKVVGQLLEVAEDDLDYEAGRFFMRYTAEIVTELDRFQCVMTQGSVR